MRQASKPVGEFLKMIGVHIGFVSDRSVNRVAQLLRGQRRGGVIKHICRHNMGLDPDRWRGFTFEEHHGTMTRMANNVPKRAMAPRMSPQMPRSLSSCSIMRLSCWNFVILFNPYSVDGVRI